MRTEAGNLRSSARMNRATAKAINPLMQAGATLLTEGAKWGGSFVDYSDSGALDTSRERWGKIGSKVKNWLGG